MLQKDLKAGQKLDGEGGYCARGRLISSKRSKQERISSRVTIIMQS